MIGWLWRFLVGRFSSCGHAWETVESVTLVETRGGIPTGYKKHLRCTKCGDWKAVRL